jgi:hypothetical protein
MGYLRILRTSTQSLLTLSALSKSLQDCTFGVSQDTENTNPVLDNCRQFFSLSPQLPLAMPRNNPGQQRARPHPEGPNKIGVIAAGVGISANNDGRHRHEPGRDTLMTHTARTIGLNGRREEVDLNDFDDSQEYQAPRCQVARFKHGVKRKKP